MLKSPLHEFVNDCIARNQELTGSPWKGCTGSTSAGAPSGEPRPLQPELSEPGCAQRTSSPTATAACAPGWQ